MIAATSPLASKPVPLRLPECFKAPVQPGLRAVPETRTSVPTTRQTPRLCGWGTWIRTKIDGVRVRHVMPKNFASSRAGKTQKPDALAIVAKRVCEACQTAESSESDRTRSKHPFRAEAREYHFYCLATAALASSRTSLRDHGFEVNRTPPGRTMFETGLPDVTRTST